MSERSGLLLALNFDTFVVMFSVNEMQCQFLKYAEAKA